MPAWHGRPTIAARLHQFTTSLSRRRALNSMRKEAKAAAALTARTSHPAQGAGPHTMRTEDVIAAAAGQVMRGG